MKVELMKYMVNSVELGHSFYHLENLNQFEEFLNEYKPQVLFTSFQIKEIPLTLDQMCEALRLAKKYHTNLIADAGRETLTEENVESTSATPTEGESLIERKQREKEERDKVLNEVTNM